jgi:large subunit ribosomal protein L4
MPRVKKTETTTVAATKSNKLTVDILDLTGKAIDKISLPEEIFAAKINKVLIAQAVKVYLANQRQGTASTKTRGEVEGSTRKIYRQKGTGRARHGSIRAPIFVHGGVVFGPKPRDYSLKLPQKMKRKALFSALSAKFNDGEIKILQDLEKLEPKTKKFAEVIKNLGLENKKKKVLLITAAETENLKRAAQNIEGVTITAAQRLNTYDILNHRQLIFMKQALEKLSQHFLKQAPKNKKEEK